MDRERGIRDRLRYTEILHPEVDTFLMNVFRGNVRDRRIMDPTKQKFSTLANVLFRGAGEIIDAYTKRHPDQSVYHVSKEIPGLYRLILTESEGFIDLRLLDGQENMLIGFTLNRLNDRSYSVQFTNLEATPRVFVSTDHPSPELTRGIRWAAGNLAVWQEYSLGLPDEVTDL
jgi:hypothetical protein